MSAIRQRSDATRTSGPLKETSPKPRKHESSLTPFIRTVKEAKDKQHITLPI
ncbi:hypothetical protein KIN20_019711 [Parelaphostrongylus tenuis]|uniref:Uncharacterized protein n=1 Tax=Parelaphostrongylus tenuis TaxID=148309 RepID=A0AAD5N3E6_PARTN|nr:hypothetical protein KIN20_019711 [Parelaphostrongylus tenuis]